MMTLNVERFKQAPVCVSAVQFDGKNSKNIVEWIKSEGGSARAGGSYILIFTPSGTLKVTRWGWVVMGLENVFYTHSNSVFNTTHRYVRLHPTKYKINEGMAV